MTPLTTSSSSTLAIVEEPGGVGDGQSQLIKDLLWAVARGSVQKVRQLVEQHPALLNAGLGVLGTALQQACHDQCGEIVTYLLDQGADINLQKGDLGHSVLHEAVWGG